MDLFYIILINKFHVTILTLYNRALLYVDIVQNRVNKTVTEKLSLQAFRAHIRLFRLAWGQPGTMRDNLKS